MTKAKCVGADQVEIETPRTLSGPAGCCISIINAERARRFAAELIVAAERAERLENDMRAPG